MPTKENSNRNEKDEKNTNSSKTDSSKIDNLSEITSQAMLIRFKLEQMQQKYAAKALFLKQQSDLANRGYKQILDLIVDKGMKKFTNFKTGVDDCEMLKMNLETSIVNEFDTVPDELGSVNTPVKWYQYRLHTTIYLDEKRDPEDIIKEYAIQVSIDKTSNMASFVLYYYDLNAGPNMSKAKGRWVLADNCDIRIDSEGNQLKIIAKDDIDIGNARYKPIILGLLQPARVNKP